MGHPCINDPFCSHLETVVKKKVKTKGNVHEMFHPDRVTRERHRAMPVNALICRARHGQGSQVVGVGRDLAAACH
jgi:hypothetical protein